MIAALRLRGEPNIRGEVRDTLKMLRLNRVNHCVLLPEKPEFIGMLKKAKDWVTWGKINTDMAVKLFQKRGMLKGRKKLTLKELEKITKYSTFEDFFEEMAKGKISFKDYPEIKPVFRLNPPKKGFKSIRKPYPKGDLGDRKEKINELLERMI